MKKIRIVILCASAMSSGIIVESIQNVAPQMGVDCHVECAASIRYRDFNYSTVDVIMIAPQIKMYKPQILPYLKERGYDKIPVIDINMRDYGLAHGKPILEAALKAVEEANNDE